MIKAKTFAGGFWDAFALRESTLEFLKVKVKMEKKHDAVPGA